MVAKDAGIELAVVFPLVRTDSELKKGLDIVADMDVGVTALGMTISALYQAGRPGRPEQPQCRLGP